jgi:hypothetical protein
VDSIYKQYADDLAFLFVYIREAHPSDGPPARRTPKPAPGGGGHGALAQPKTDAERHAAAQRCVEGLELTVPTLVDGIEDGANLAYGAWPDRLFVVDLNGKVAFAGGPGPSGFDPEAWAAAIAKVVPAKAPAAAP